MLLLLGRKLGTETGLLGSDSSMLAGVMVGFAVVALVRFIPLLGELVWTILSIIGLGLAVVTRLGSPAAEASAS